MFKNFFRNLFRKTIRRVDGRVLGTITRDGEDWVVIDPNGVEVDRTPDRSLVGWQLYKNASSRWSVIPMKK
jgi:hypothetical protein